MSMRGAGDAEEDALPSQGWVKQPVTGDSTLSLFGVLDKVNLVNAANKS